METIEENTFAVSQNYPNPFDGKTDVYLSLPEKENINITIHDILGRELTQYKNILQRGNHAFSFYSGSGKYYLFTVKGNHTSQTIKMINAKNNTTNRKRCKIVYNKYEDKAIGYKSQQAINKFVFNLDDELQYTGYANTPDGILGSDVIDYTPQASKDYVFFIKKGLRCPGAPTITDINGNIYNTVQIGTQCWMAENLRTKTYQNSTPIPNVTNNGSWSYLTTGAYVWYNNDTIWEKRYGALYNWFAAVDANGLCPAGWHLPSNDEWTTLTDVIGGPGSPHGNELKSCKQVNSPLGGICNTTKHPRWHEHNNEYGTDDYGFSGFPGGYRNIDGIFDSNGGFSFWWSSTEFSLYNAWNRTLGFCYGYVIVGNNEKQDGFSVRCLKD